MSSAFNKNGMVLQDIVNELGRRLGFNVTNGRYQGVSNAVGNDGLWKSPEGNSVLIEVKTTDTYRVSLDTIAKYRDKLEQGGVIDNLNSMLLVVGREDTGELEAQVRGSRHAWDMRLISIDSLVRLVKLKESTEGAVTGSKIRSILIPLEYTRLDTLIDVMFTAAKDIESTIDSEIFSDSEAEDKPHRDSDFTDKELIKEKRNQIINSLGKKYSIKLISKSPALFWNADHNFRAACSVSKRYFQPGQLPYWYAYHPKWDEFLGDAEIGFFVLGCMDLNIAFSIPVSIVRGKLQELNKTIRSDGSMYWHIKIIETKTGIYSLQVPVTGSHLPISEYIFDIKENEQ